MGVEQKSDVRDPRLSRGPLPLAQRELEAVCLLGGVSLESVFGLLSRCAVLEPPAGTVLISPERDERLLYMVLQGALAVYLEPSLSDPIARLAAGQSVGEIAVIDARRASAYVVTTEPSRLLAIDESTFWRLISVSHAFAANLLHVLAQRMRVNNAQLTASVERGRVLERDALTDALTGLHNRRWLDQRLPRLIARHTRSARPLSLMLLDIDHFKRFNDDYGHLAGDQVLALVGERLLAQLRPTDLAARYGGEEFIVVLPDTGLEGARVAAERLRSEIAKVRAAGVDRPIKLSAGMATLEAGDNASVLIERADEKLYLAKSRGRDRVES